MRKYSKFLVLGGALAALAVPSAAMATVAVTNGVGTVDKGDVQTALHMNDSALQSAWTNHKISFTHTQHSTQDESWTCADGTPMHTGSSTTMTFAETATPTLAQGKVVGWTLSQGPIQSFAYTPTGAQYAGECATGGTVYAPINSTNSTTDTLMVNNADTSAVLATATY
jgi:hypothetical protein